MKLDLLIIWVYRKFQKLLKIIEFVVEKCDNMENKVNQKIKETIKEPVKKREYKLLTQKEISFFKRHFMGWIGLLQLTQYNYKISVECANDNRLAWCQKQGDGLILINLAENSRKKIQFDGDLSRTLKRIAQHEALEVLLMEGTDTHFKTERLEHFINEYCVIDELRNIEKKENK